MLAELPPRASGSVRLRGGTDLRDSHVPPSASTPAPKSAALLGGLRNKGARTCCFRAPVPGGWGPGVTDPTPASVSMRTGDPSLPAQYLGESVGTGRGEVYAEYTLRACGRDCLTPRCWRDLFRETKRGLRSHSGAVTARM